MGIFPCQGLLELQFLKKQNLKITSVSLTAVNPPHPPYGLLEILVSVHCWGSGSGLSFEMFPTQRKLLACFSPVSTVICYCAIKSNSKESSLPKKWSTGLPHYTHLLVRGLNVLRDELTFCSCGWGLTSCFPFVHCSLEPTWSCHLINHWLLWLFEHAAYKEGSRFNSWLTRSENVLAEARVLGDCTLWRFCEGKLEGHSVSSQV